MRADAEFTKTGDAALTEQTETSGAEQPAHLASKPLQGGTKKEDVPLVVEVRDGGPGVMVRQ